ncbi:MAG: hypothetical protein K8T90_19900 [Planctomycetes bacterium]|nr:hypothetical protein [Planctomycetota bacterium]
MTLARCPFEDDVLLLADATGPDAMSPTRRIVVEAHLAVCSSCAATEDALDLAASAMRATTVPPLGAADAALARIANDCRAPAFHVRRPAVAAAAVLCVAALAVAALIARRGPPDVTPTAAPRRAASTPEPAVAPSVAMPEGPAPTSFPTSLRDLPAQIDALNVGASADDPALAEAVRHVTSTGAPGSWALAGLLDASDPTRALRAVMVAEKVRSSSLVPPLGALLRDVEDGRDPGAAPRGDARDPAVDIGTTEGAKSQLAASTARALAAIGTPAALAELATALDGPSRRTALDAIATCRTSRALDLLADRIRGGRDGAPGEIVDAAVASWPRESARLLLDLSADRALAPLASSALRAHGAELAPHLIPFAAKGDGLVAAAAVRALGETRQPSALAALRSAAARSGLARPAVAALVAIGTDDAYAAAFDVVADPRTPRDLVQVFDGADDAVGVLAAAIGDARLPRRLAAADALGWTRSPDAVEPLARAARDAALRRAAIDALGRIRGDESAAALAVWARPKTADPALVAALGATGSSVAVPSLRALAREPALAASAARALAGIEDAEAVLALAELLAEPRTARAAAESLASMPAGVVVPALLGRLEDPADAAASARARRALVLVAGADLGRTPDAWHTWWDGRRPRTQERSR